MTSSFCFCHNNSVFIVNMFSVHTRYHFNVRHFRTIKSFPLKSYIFRPRTGCGHSLLSAPRPYTQKQYTQPKVGHVQQWFLSDSYLDKELS